MENVRGVTNGGQISRSCLGEEALTELPGDKGREDRNIDAEHGP